MLNPITQQTFQDLAVIPLHRVPMLFLPSAWAAAKNSARVWQSQSFPPTPRTLIPKQPGVYIFIVKPQLFDFDKASGLFYIGKAKSLYTRISAYIGELNKEFTKSNRPLVWRMINQWDGHLHYYYTITNNVTEAEDLENEMLSAFRPYFNNEYEAEVSMPMRAFK